MKALLTFLVITIGNIIKSYIARGGDTFKLLISST